MNTITTTRKHWTLFWIAWAAWLIASVAVSRAATVTLEWDPPAGPPTVVGYRMYLKTGTGLFVKAADIAQGVEHTFQSLPAGAYSAYVTAFTAEGIESGPSNTVTFNVPASPGKLRIKVAVETSGDNGETWEVASTTVIPVNNE